MIDTLKIYAGGYKINDNLHIKKEAVINIKNKILDNSDYIITADEQNMLTKWDECLAWLKNNTPEPEFTEAELMVGTKRALTSAVQNHLDSAAKAKGYDNILSACSYAYSASAFGDEGRAFVIWRDAVWAYCYQVLADVEAGGRTIPTPEELTTELPNLEIL